MTKKKQSLVSCLATLILGFIIIPCEIPTVTTERAVRSTCRMDEKSGKTWLMWLSGDGPIWRVVKETAWDTDPHPVTPPMPYPPRPER